jgi:thiosulfate/3-mercaptopyruvate sulfurtransferase
MTMSDPFTLDRMPFPALVTTDWLAFRLGLPGLVVLDASLIKVMKPDGTYIRRPAWLEFETSGHIPGARYADLIHDFSAPNAAFEFTRPGVRQMEAAAGAVGLSAANQIVIYDNADGIWAARLWWLLRAYGHEEVAVIDGGLKKWIGEGRPTAFGTTLVKTATYRAKPQPGFFVDKADIIDVIEGRTSGRLVCVLRPEVFSGSKKVYSRAGHIPGSISAPYVDLVDERTNTLQPLAALQSSLAPLLKDDGRIIVYCGGGITAAGTALTLNVLGITNVAIYDGSLAEWSADLNLPLDVGFG